MKKNRELKVHHSHGLRQHGFCRLQRVWSHIVHKAARDSVYAWRHAAVEAAMSAITADLVEEKVRVGLQLGTRRRGAV